MKIVKQGIDNSIPNLWLITAYIILSRLVTIEGSIYEFHKVGRSRESLEMIKQRQRTKNEISFAGRRNGAEGRNDELF